MKKFLALFLVLILAFSLCACGDDPGNNPDNPDNPDNPPVDTNSIGYYDDVMPDPYSREKYKFVYIYGGPDALTDNMMDCFVKLGDKYNYEVTEFCSNGDNEAFLQALEVEANKGCDGFFMQGDIIISPRIMELMAELEVPYIQLFTPFDTDANGANLVPTVALDQYYAGKCCMEWYAERYKEYWGDIDLSKLCLLSIGYSTSPPLATRSVGAMETFAKLFPGAGEIEVDGVSIGKLNLDSGYTIASQTISAHPEYDYWIIFGCTEDVTQGTARYAETTPKPENILICCSGSNVLPLEFESGYDGTSWKVAYAVADICYAGVAVTGMVAMADGRADFDTLWVKDRAPGDKATIKIVDAIMVTKDNWSNFKDETWELYK